MLGGWQLPLLLKTLRRHVETQGQSVRATGCLPSPGTYSLRGPLSMRPLLSALAVQGPGPLITFQTFSPGDS